MRVRTKTQTPSTCSSGKLVLLSDDRDNDHVEINEGGGEI